MANIALAKDSVQVDDCSDWRLEDGEGCGLENFVHTMEELEEFAQAKRGLDFLSGGGNTRTPADVKPSMMMMADMEDIFDFNERLSSPEYERYRSFRRLSVLDEVSLVSQYLD